MALLLSAMATNRKNTSVLIDKIEEELGRYGRTSAEFDISDVPQQFIVPYNKAGWYKIELWHKKNSESKYRYLSAVVELADNQHLNFYVKENEYAKVMTTSKGKSQLLLEADDSYSSTDITGDGVIDDGTIQVLNVLNIPASSMIQTKAKIQLLGATRPPSADSDFTSGYSYYIKDSEDNFMGLNGHNPTGTKYDDKKSLKWLIEQNSDGTYKIINTSNNQALYDDNSGSLKMAEFDPDNEQQKWELFINSPSTYYIINKQTGKLLNIYDGSIGTDRLLADTITLIKADY